MAAATTETWGTSQLAEYVNSQTGSDYDGYGIRILLRQLAKDNTIERGEGRYAFSGPKDKTVVAVVKAVKSGAAEKAKQGRLDELKAKRAQKAATEEAPAKPARGRKTAAAAPPAEKPARTRTRKAAAAKPAPEESDDDLDIDEI